MPFPFPFKPDKPYFYCHKQLDVATKISFKIFLSLSLFCFSSNLFTQKCLSVKTTPPDCGLQNVEHFFKTGQLSAFGFYGDVHILFQFDSIKEYDDRLIAFKGANVCDLNVNSLVIVDSFWNKNNIKKIKWITPYTLKPYEDKKMCKNTKYFVILLIFILICQLLFIYLFNKRQGVLAKKVEKKNINLTKGEKEIIEYLRKGYSNKIIAKNRGVTINAVKMAKNRLGKKLDINWKKFDNDWGLIMSKISDD